MKKIASIIFIIIFSYTLFADVALETESLKLAISEYEGNVCLYKKTDKGNFEPLLNSKQFSKTPSFYINVDGIVYPVNVVSGFDISTSISGSEVTFVATLKNTVTLSVTYSFFSSQNNDYIDSVKVTPVVVNLSDSEIEFGLKAMFDTILGENTNTHFYSTSKKHIDSETMFANFTFDTWIHSKNADGSLNFVVFPSQLSFPRNAIIAGKKSLYTNSWNFNYKKGRTFNSINSYNDSALCFVWDDVVIGKDSVSNYEFYIYTGKDDLNTLELMDSENKDVPKDLPVTKSNPIEEIIRISKAVKNNEIQLTDSQLITLIGEADAFLYDDKNFVLMSKSTEDDVVLMKNLLDIINKIKAKEKNATHEELVALNLLLDQMLEKAEW